MEKAIFTGAFNYKVIEYTINGDKINIINEYVIDETDPVIDTIDKHYSKFRDRVLIWNFPPAMGKPDHVYFL